MNVTPFRTVEKSVMCAGHPSPMRKSGTVPGWAILLWFAFSDLSGVLGAGEARLRVVTSFMPLYCFASQVAGDAAEVQNLLPGNVGPHEYQPSRSDHDKLRKADLFIVNGLKLEDWVITMTKARREPLHVVEASRGLESELIYDVPTLSLSHSKKAVDTKNAATDPNPHVWLDPVLAMRMVTNILEAFRSADPGHSDDFQRNAARFLERLQKLDREYREGLSAVSTVPCITSHDAFAYLARRYQLNVLGVIEVIPEVGPSLKYQGQLKRLVQSRGVKVIFGEPQSTGKSASQLAADTGVRLASLDTLETADAKGLRPTAYEDAMRENLKVLLENLK